MNTPNTLCLCLSFLWAHAKDKIRNWW